MSERLLLAAQRLEDLLGAGAETGAGSVLRRDQLPVFRSAAEYLVDVATRPGGEDRQPAFACIVQPPRTGKTVVAAHVIAASGLSAVFVVPSRTLVTQTCHELARHVPGLRVGRFDGDEIRVVRKGVNVTTYSMLHSRTRKRVLPKAMRSAPLVFLDEAHHTMTEARTQILRESFDPASVRIGLTATPDYDQQRALERYFPDLVHKIELDEALRLGLLAPARVWVADVDEDGSQVSMIGGDFDGELLGRLLSSAPAFEAARAFRYAETRRKKGAMIACASRQQAFDLLRFLEKHRPPRSFRPRLLLGDTPASERQQVLEAFERGRCDTLIQVGVLIEGWTSQRCKVLVDLAPSMSRVRSTQKYFRAMTRRGSEEAHLFVVLPKDLPSPPLLPNEIMGLTGEYTCGDLLDKSEPGESPRPVRQYSETPVSGVKLRQRLVVSTRLARPTLQKGDWPAVREVLRSCADWNDDHRPSVRAFLWMVFDHPSFCGHGSFLLRWLGFAATRVGYAALIGSAYPGLDILDLVAQRPGPGTTDTCTEDVAVLLRELSGERTTERDLESATLALAGGSDEPPPLQDAQLEQYEAIVRTLLTTVTSLKPNERFALIGRYGVGAESESTFRDLVTLYGRSVERIRQIELKAWSKMIFFERAFGLREDQRIRHGITPFDAAADAAPAAEPVDIRFLGKVLRELSLFELHAGDLEAIWDEKKARERRARRVNTPRDLDSWRTEIREALDYADRSEDASRREAILVAVVVRACRSRRRPRLTTSDLLSLIRSAPDGLRTDRWREVFARWYLEAHGQAGRMHVRAVCSQTERASSTATNSRFDG